MSKELETQFLKKLKLLLSFNIFFIIVSIFIVCYVLITTKVIKYQSIYQNGEVNIKGKILNYSIDGDKLSLEIKTQEKIKANYYIKEKEEKDYLSNNLCLNCTIELNGKISDPINNTIPNTFNYKNYLYNKRIYKIINITSFKIKNDNNFLYKIKDYLYKRTSSLAHSDYLKIFILGDKSLIASEEYSLYQENGVAHLLAISGMHIGVILKILESILANTNKYKKYITISLVLLFYAFLTGFSASIMRAVLFYILLNLKKLLSLKISNFKVLLYTAYLLLFLNPFYLYDIGFIYSFTITGGIILAHKYLQGNYLHQLLKLSLVSFLVCLPITAALNYEVNLTSLLANMIFVPFVSLVLYPICLLYFLIPFIEPVFTFLIGILELLNKIFGQISFLITIPKMPVGLIILYYLIIILVLKNIKYLLWLGPILIINYVYPKLDSAYYVYYLDIGQGDSSLIISPYQKEINMIDTGGELKEEKETWQEKVKNYNVSDNTIKFLKSMGINKIDNLIITHGDEDHGGEIFNIASKIKILNVVLNSNEDTKLEQNIRNNFKVTNYINSNINFKSINNKKYESENDNSIVLYFNLFKFRFLYLGDISKTVEEEIIKENSLKVNFLKIAHHGSKNSSSPTFIENTIFNLGIISCGRNNRYGHPHQETLDTLKKYQRNYVTTARDGTIKIKIRPNNYTIYNYAP